MFFCPEFKKVTLATLTTVCLLGIYLFLTDVSMDTIRSLLSTQTKNSSEVLSPEVFSLTTTMTFNQTLVVGCKESPYLECFPSDIEAVTSHRMLKIAFVRRPGWFTDAELSLANCHIDRCVFETVNDTSQADIVIVHGVDLRDNYPVPRRQPGQVFIIYVIESPVHTRSGFVRNGNSPWNYQINLIMSFRLDVGMSLPYDRLRFEPKPLHQRPNYYDIAKRKTRTAVWLVSNCNTPSLREHYVHEMQKYIDIDIFGRCGIRCNPEFGACKEWTIEYKFYLAFENSLCTDYVTEKFFKIFDPNIHMIPVVRGGADYDKHFPNFTYINSAHFKTPKDLALHLKDLASDLETYSKYLEYKDLYTVVPYVNNGCKICTFLHTHQLPDPSQIYNLTSWLGLQHCHHPTDLP